MKRILWLLAVVFAVLVGGPSSSWADVAEDQAKEYFSAGVQSYKAGQFLTAGQAFMEAYKLADKPLLLFSIGQAFRRQFMVGQKNAHLRVAVDHYRKYLDLVKTGGKRLEAAQALSELAPYIAAMERAGAGTEALTFATTVTMSSPTPGAVVSLDGGPVHKVPLSQEVKPGQHKVLIQAPGYVAEERVVDAVEGRLVALDVPLRGMPALLAVEGAEGAEVSVDGRVLGEAPFGRPMELTPGRHYVAVTDRGHKAYADELSFENGATTKLTLDLPQTNQRTGSYIVLGTAVGAYVATGVLAGLAFKYEGDATEVGDAQEAGTITEEQRIDHNAAVGTRDDLVTAAFITAGAGTAVGITGLLLYLLDQPDVKPPPARVDEPEDKPATEPEEPGMDVLAAPILAPGIYGLSARLRF
ncbi:MAG: PEGA domain-containing protein [Deltaproteobacteria bacterium]|nr:PEGA domain-containing protein [Deltaproteobacteria bacterium]